jgi:hypothetical protein
MSSLVRLLKSHFIELLDILLREGQDRSHFIAGRLFLSKFDDVVRHQLRHDQNRPRRRTPIIEIPQNEVYPPFVKCCTSEHPIN